MIQIRLNKYIAEKGYCSRRKADELIGFGKVEVNGKIIEEFGIKVSDEDVVKVEGHVLKESNRTNGEKVYIILNKPVGYISSTTSSQGRCITDLIPKKLGRLFPVGRLDKDSEGLMILTNDGELTNILTHPKYQHEKEYEVVIDKELTKEDIKSLEEGFKVDSQFMKMHSVKVLYNLDLLTYQFILTEGKKRQIRVMLKKLEYKTLKLKRVRINKLKLGNLPVEKWKEIKKENII